MLYFRKSKKGFTLIELMVVVAIIGVLALLGLRVYSTQQDKAKEAIVKANAGSVQVTIQTALVDKPTLTKAQVVDGTTLPDLKALHNPFSGLTGNTNGTATIANVVITLGNMPTNDAPSDTAAGLVGVYQDTTSDGVFTIVGFGKDGTPIDDYLLTARK